MALGNDGHTLPAGWRWVKLGEVCSVVNGYGFANHLQGRTDLPFPFVKVSDMNAEGAGTFVSSAANTVDVAILKELRAKTYPAGTVIFPKVGGALLTNKKRVLTVEGTFDNNIMGLVPQNVDGDWLFAWIQTVDLRTLANTQALPSIKQSRVASLHIPLPPLPEQKRIAAILTVQMAAVEKARTAAEARLKAAKELPAAYLREVFESEEAQGWPRRPLGELCDITAQLVDPKKEGYSCLPHVFGNNIESGMCRLTYLNTAEEDGMTSGKYLFKAGDVLYSKLRPYLRKVLVSDFDGLCSADMYPIEVNPDVLDAHFTAWMLLSDKFTKYADEQSRRARMPKLNRDQLFAWVAPVPPLNVQSQLIARHREKMAQVEVLLRLITDELDTINESPAALLRQAFSGKL